MLLGKILDLRLNCLHIKSLTDMFHQIKPEKKMNREFRIKSIKIHRQKKLFAKLVLCKTTKYFICLFGPTPFRCGVASVN